MTQGDQPDFVFLHKQLHKALLVFTGDFLKEEGIFRQNASLKDVNVSANKFAHGQDTLDDYESPIQVSTVSSNPNTKVAHTFKNVVRRYTIIPKTFQHRIYQVFEKYNLHQSDEIVFISRPLSLFSECRISCPILSNQGNQ